MDSPPLAASEEYVAAEFQATFRSLSIVVVVACGFFRIAFLLSATLLCVELLLVVVVVVVAV